MFTITKKANTPNIIWDPTANRPLCRFTNGKLETNDEALVEKLKGMGYEVTGEANQPGGEPSANENSDTVDKIPAHEQETPKSNTEERKRATK